MTDTTTPAPTNAEILDLWADVVAKRRSSDDIPVVVLVRDALAKWGAPATASGENETCKCCGEGSARIVVRRECDTCTSVYAGVAEHRLQKSLAAPPAQEARESCTLSYRIAELAEQHGSLRAAARSLDFDPGYLARLQSGEKCSPSPALLERLGLRQVITYERGTT